MLPVGFTEHSLILKSRTLEVLKSKESMLEDLLGIKAQGALVLSRLQGANHLPASFLAWRKEMGRFLHT